MVAFYTVFPLLELTVWIGLLLDRIFFPGFRMEAVSSPLFIIGNPRSGTTFLHRLISKDVGRFTTMRMWEILFAPSIIQRKILYALSAIFCRLGQLFRSGLDRIEKNWYRNAGLHQISFNQPEEDDYLLLHIWSALTCGLSAGLVNEALPYTYFDSQIPVSKRKRILSFYEACIQRHLHAQRLRQNSQPGIYLAKNPALCPKVRSIKEKFADAKFIYLVRSPLEMLPSYVSMMMYSWRAVGIRYQEDDLRAFITDMARHWYDYPLAQLETFQKNHVAVVRYEDLIREPEKTVKGIYKQLQFQIEPDFERILHEESARAGNYKSRHQYDISVTGLSHDRLFEEFRAVFDSFGFEKKGF